MYDLLVSAYKMFKMFMGPFKDIPLQELYTTCEEFFTPVSFLFYIEYLFNVK